MFSVRERIQRRRSARTGWLLGTAMGLCAVCVPMAAAAVASDGGGVDHKPTQPAGRDAAATAGQDATAVRHVRMVVEAPARVTVPRNRWRTVVVRVRNEGTALARAPKLSVSAGRGVQVKVVGAKKRTPRVRALAAMRPGKARAVRVRLRATKAAKTSTRVVSTARARGKGKLRDRATTSLRIAGTGAGPVKGNALAGRYFYGWVSHIDWAWDNRGLYFSNDHWAHVGLPPEGLPECTARTEVLDDKGAPTGDGCRPYTYDAASGALKVGDLAGTYDLEKLTLDDVDFTELYIPTAGERYDAALTHRGFHGLCGLITGCTTSTKTFALNTLGEFVKTSYNISTLGGVGTPFVGAGSFPPDEAGHYEILSGGRIQLRYLDGTVKVETIGVDRNTEGRPDPAGTGLVLGATNFYPEID